MPWGEALVVAAVPVAESTSSQVEAISAAQAAVLWLELEDLIAAAAAELSVTAGAAVARRSSSAPEEVSAAVVVGESSLEAAIAAEDAALA